MSEFSDYMDATIGSTPVAAKASDYTPTTGDVEVSYAERAERVCGTRHFAAGAEFDRWLAEVKAAAWDEGHAAGYEDHRSEGQFIRFTTINPHRTP